MRKSACPGCGKTGKKQATFDRADGSETVYTCHNDEGFLLPNCNVAQWTVINDQFGMGKEVDMEKTEI